MKKSHNIPLSCCKIKVFYSTFNSIFNSRSYADHFVFPPWGKNWVFTLSYLTNLPADLTIYCVLYSTKFIVSKLLYTVLLYVNRNQYQIKGYKMISIWMNVFVEFHCRSESRIIIKNIPSLRNICSSYIHRLQGHFVLFVSGGWLS